MDINELSSGKELREAIEAEFRSGKVTTHDAMCRALNYARLLKAKIAALKDGAKKFLTLHDMLVEGIFDYSDAHANALDVPMRETRDGVEVGEIVIDDYEYHLVRSGGEYKRVGDNALSQRYLETVLPETWVKQSLKLNNSAIKADNPDDETLEQYGLERTEHLSINVSPVLNND